MMQKLELRTVDLKPTKIEHVDSVNVFAIFRFCFIAISINLI